MQASFSVCKTLFHIHVMGYSFISKSNLLSACLAIIPVEPYLPPSLNFPLHPSSPLRQMKTTTVFLRDSTGVSDAAMLLFGGNDLTASSDPTHLHMLDGYLDFFLSPPSAASTVMRLRGELDRLLGRKVSASGGGTAFDSRWGWAHGTYRYLRWALCY